jgi:hypothetical protein
MEQTDGLASTASATSTAGLDTVLLQVGPVGVTGTGVQVHGAVAVVLGSLVLVHDAHANGRAQGDSKLGARLDLDLVLFIARCRDGALSRSTSGHLRLDVGLCELHARRHSVDDASDTEAVRLAIAVQGCISWRGYSSMLCVSYVVTLKCVPKVDMMCFCDYKLGNQNKKQERMFNVQCLVIRYGSCLEKVQPAIGACPRLLSRIAAAPESTLNPTSLDPLCQPPAIRNIHNIPSDMLTFMSHLLAP